MPLENRICFQVNLRDRLQCRQCGKLPSSQGGYHQGFEYHHQQPRSEGGTDEVENIVLLCRLCHQQQHRSGIAPDPLDLSAVRLFPCKHCGITLDSASVAMNCGWYHCHGCQRQTHLFSHFYA